MSRRINVRSLKVGGFLAFMDKNGPHDRPWLVTIIRRLDHGFESTCRGYVSKGRALVALVRVRQRGQF